MRNLKALLLGTALAGAAALGAPGLVRPAGATPPTFPGPFQRVLLISVDGLHSADLYAWFHYARFGIGFDELRNLSLTGTVFLNAQAPVPSNDFPGIIAPLTGATPKSSGVFYDRSYDRTLFPAGSACAGQPGTPVVYDQTIDKSPGRLDGGGTLGQTVSQIDRSKLPLQLAGSTCTPVMPHSYLRVNTVFEEVKRQYPTARTAWADIHPSYEILNGPSGLGVDDLYTPEIKGNAGTGSGLNYTQSYYQARLFDDMNVQAVINEINGLDSTGTHAADVPAVFGMSFASTAIGQQLAQQSVDDQPTPDAPNGLFGGYLSAAPTGAVKGTGMGKGQKCILPGWWNTALVSLQVGCPGYPKATDPKANIAKVLGQLSWFSYELNNIVTALNARGLFNSTLIIITAKYGNAPVDPTLRNPTDASGYATATGANYAYGAFDDVGLVWLNPNTRTMANYASTLTKLQKQQTIKTAPLRTQQVLADFVVNLGGGSYKVSGSTLQPNFNSPFADSRTPDYIGVAQQGVMYTSDPTVIAQHGGFSDDDRNVALMVSGPNLPGVTNAQPVETRQIAPTILSALGLPYSNLQGVQQEKTQPLPVALQ